MKPNPTFFAVTVPLTINIYSSSKKEALAELEKRIDGLKHVPGFCDPSFDKSSPGTGFTYIRYDATRVTIEEDIRMRAYVAAKVDGETLEPFFIRHDPLSDEPIGENDSD